ncbi:hypothetical protein ETAA8_25770 [Anatilimnocola aggregata]|uniref:Uncharacterized protein n=1 Tax=Anatilimnocola aggregata TaxID=2528021 RepID=A0A517YBE4_9BACT|nr:hypothetical protein ETAA8_25770 [Anatilimnocola aggregata]
MRRFAENLELWKFPVHSPALLTAFGKTQKGAIKGGEVAAKIWNSRANGRCPGDAFQTRCQLGDGSRSPGGMGSKPLSLKQQKSGQEAVLVFRIGAFHQATVK